MPARLVLLALLAVASLLIPTGVAARQGTPSAASGEVQQFADDTYAFVSGGYVSLFIVTDEGVIATDPASLVDPGRAEAYAAAIASVTDQPVRYVIYSHDHADHATGGGVFAETATFVSHENAVEKIAALGDANTPVPSIAFNDEMTLELGGTSVELYYTGRNHSDNSVVLLHPEQGVAFAVDFIPVDSLPYQDLPDAYPQEWIDSLAWVEENLDFDTLVIGHPPVSGTKENVGQVRAYLEALMASVQAAQDEGLADNSPEMVDAVRADLEAEYGSWANFEEWLPLNVEGLLRAGMDAAATPAP
jgi:glyoxylase-like metal-dependent hydrolase (beta-lactamase superfamily II)